jgi:hypothetical protein
MGLNLSKTGLVGVVLMLVGTLAFLPGLFPGSGRTTTLVLLPVAAILLTYGTYLVGTDGDSRPV